MMVAAIVLTGVMYILFKDFYRTWGPPNGIILNLPLTIPLLLATTFLIFDFLILIAETTLGSRST